MIEEQPGQWRMIGKGGEDYGPACVSVVPSEDGRRAGPGLGGRAGGIAVLQLAGGSDVAAQAGDGVLVLACGKSPMHCFSHWQGTVRAARPVQQRGGIGTASLFGGSGPG